MHGEIKYEITDISPLPFRQIGHRRVDISLKLPRRTFGVISNKEMDRT